MRKEENRNEIRQITEKNVIRNELNSRIAFATEHPTGTVLEWLNTVLM
ncbi:MAG: hypothetical protein LUC97_04785 [Clostridiales bacterium]|nr:hypothetical protein [Clostridiales bacterium]